MSKPRFEEEGKKRSISKMASRKTGLWWSITKQRNGLQPLMGGSTEGQQLFLK